MSNHENDRADACAVQAGQPSRRDVVIGATAATMAAGVPTGSLAQPRTNGAMATVAVSFTVNGTGHKLSLDPRSSLLDVLREQLALTGAKKGCDHGQCGACTVHIDGRRVVSCLTPAVQVDGREVHDDRGAVAARRRAASDAAGLHRPRCAAMRLLHARPDHGGGRLRARGPRRRRPSRSANT